MARQVLENGVVLPAEYSDDWYDDMTSNLTKLDDVIGSDSEKLSSADVGAAALSNSYNDLDNLPTIPTKTSDLTNDSNFVDTSNSAVASGITSAKVTSYDSHVADTDIHVTTADKTKWNTVTSKANDSDVVHKSGDETVGGVKTFTDNISLKSLTAEYTVTGGVLSVTYSDKNGLLLAQNKLGNYQSGISYNKFSIFAYDSNNQLIDRTLTYSSSSSTLATAFFRPDNNNIVSLGTAGNRWSKIYGTEYYYGANNVEFSTKFVTTDTAQTISGAKTFSSNINVYNSDSTTDTANIILKNSKAERGSTTNIGEQTISFLDKDNAQIGQIKCEVDAGGVSTLTLQCTNSSNSSSGIRLRRTSTGTFLQPVYNNGCNLGTNGYRWYDVQTRAVNNLEPSSLSLPSGNLNDIIDISSYLTYLDGSSANTYIAPANGWISITMGNCSGIQAYITGLWGHQIVRPTVGGVRFLMPILKDKTANILIFGGTIDNARFIPCQGNV